MVLINSFLIYSISGNTNFPYFWAESEKDLDIPSVDVNEVKIVLAVLGYTIPESIAELKMKKHIRQLENELLQLQHNRQVFERISSQYPTINHILPFKFDFISSALQVIQYINKPRVNFDRTDCAKRIFESVKKVSILFFI